jgi:hypothetical protein
MRSKCEALCIKGMVGTARNGLRKLVWAGTFDLCIMLLRRL